MKNVIKANELSIKDSATLTTAFVKFNTTGFEGPVAILRIVNDSNVPVYISYDGDSANDYIVEQTTLLLNFQSNSAPNNYVSLLRKNSHVWVYGSAGTGLIYMAAYYLKS